MLTTMKGEKMYNKFKINEFVIVNGIGKAHDTQYLGEIAQILCRHPYYNDYNVRFQDGLEDWVDEECLQKFHKEIKK